MTSETTEFTDRYGGRPPSWLRACHGDCEAMVWVPVPFYLDPPADGELRVVVDDPDSLDEADWRAAHAAAGVHECDGWHFIRCRDCGGTGRVTWLVSVARVPRWLWKGLQFAPFALDLAHAPDGWSLGRRVWCWLDAAFVQDLRRLRR